MERARQAFQNKGLKLTPLRQSVFREIAASHKAIGAYEVLDRLAIRGERLAPISVYRAIEALVAAGIVHRFESRNAFFACHAGHEMRQLVLACEACGRVARSTPTRCSPPSTNQRRRGSRPRVRSWRCGACAPIARAKGGSRRMEAHNVHDDLPQLAPARHDHDHHHPEHDTGPPLAHDADALIGARSLWLTRSGRAIRKASTSTFQGEI